MRRFLTLSLVALLVCAGVAPFVGAGTPSATVESAAAETQEAPPDPDSDVVGWEDGYWHNESIDVDQSDGLSDAEMDRYVSRAMARVEFLREREFKRRVPVEVIPREEYRQQATNDTNNRLHGAWNNQVWEALFVVGEDKDVASVLGQTRGSAVAGFYSPTEDGIKIITPSPDRPVVSNTTLVHELTHALQDQYNDLSKPPYQGQTQDGELAVGGVVEGEANYIQALYTQRCGNEWDCVVTPSQEGASSSGPPPNLGVLLTLLQPYSDGPVYVHQIVQKRGWDGFSETFSHPPNSSEQVIHTTDEQPAPIAFEDRAKDGWKLFPKQGVNGSDTVGEASMYAMFWYQARQYGAQTVDPQALGNVDSRYDRYNYSAPPSAGWANDRVFPYHKGTGENAKYGYVWQTEWDTERDARQFHETYLNILAAHDAERTDAGYYVIGNESDPFADAFAVVRDGTRVTIVNGPTFEAVRSIRPGLDPNQATPSGTGDETDGAGTDGTTATGGGTGADGNGDSGGVIPGFGAALAVVALAAFALLARHRR